MLLAAETEGKTPEQIAEFYTDAWLEDERAINIGPVEVMPRASDHVAEMLELTATLIERGLAYQVNGTVYFDVSAFPGYGKLSGQRLEQMRAGHRVEVEADKRDPEDFALWKRAGHHRLMKWPSPWGDGFPGWHIECSAMSMKYLGERFDIHTGGIDLKFPHHEDEIAQSEGVTGHRVVSIWMHGEFLTMADAKMAKSAGNILRVADLPAKGFEPLVFRYLALTAHYRSKLDFSSAAMAAAAHGLGRARRALAAPALAPPLSDQIHTSPAGNLVLAERLAQAVLGSVHGRPVPYLAPDVSSAQRTGDRSIVVSFANVVSRIDTIDLTAQPFVVEDADGLAPQVHLAWG